MKKRILRFNRCDEKFYPYIEMVLDRIPEEAKESLLNDESLAILSCDEFCSAYGLYYDFEKPIRNMVYLNTLLLRAPTKAILHTIAHEFAHYVVGGGVSMLFEKEAEKLLVEWGFGEEVADQKYHLPIIESKGHEIGYEWAKKQKDEDLLFKFEEYYEEWDNGQLSGERFEHFMYDVDPGSIESRMLELKDKVDILKDEGLLTVLMADDGRFHKSIAWGVMAAVKEIVQRRRNNSYRYREEENKAQMIELLERIDSDIIKLFDLEAYAECSILTDDENITYDDKISSLSMVFSELLKKLRSEA